LEKAGEFSPENLAYKALRSRGITDKLYKHRDRLHSDELSIDEDVYEAEAIPDLHETRLMSELKQFMESSGYIPSYSERNDPRFKTALSVDIDTDIMPRQAKAMGLGTINRDGRPQQLKPSGKFTR
jgi:hypothetical protein